MKCLHSFLFLVFAGVVFVSCKKDTDPQETSTQPKEGLIQKLLIDSATFVINTGNIFDQNISANTSSDVGFFFKPLKDIKITSVGYKAAAIGNFNIILRKVQPLYRTLAPDTLHMETVAVKNTQDFHYKVLSKELILLKDQEFVIYCYNPTVQSIYNARYPNQYVGSNGVTWIFPMVRDNILIEEHYYSLYSGSFQYSFGKVSSNYLRGLVDFKYQQL